MSDIYDRSRLGGTTREQRRAAAQTLASGSVDATEAALLLDMVGLDPEECRDQPGEEASA